MSIENLSDYEYAHKRLSYDPETGKLTWKTLTEYEFDKKSSYTGFKRFFGKEAGTYDKNAGYVRVTIFGRKVLAHRLIWLMFNKSWPEGEIDHINGNPIDNRIENLRDVPHSENVKNAAIRKDNKSGVTGVHFYEKTQNWKANIRVDGKLKHLGTFETFSDAVLARKAAETQYGYHPNHGKR